MRSLTGEKAGVAPG